MDARTNQRLENGFSFLEMVVVMGILAVLMGLTVGVFTSTGEATQLTQAKAIITETAYKVKSASEGGGRRGVLEISKRELSDGTEVMQVGALVAQPVLSHHFETLEDASGNVTVRVNGGVDLARGEGFHGSGGRFVAGSSMEIPARSRFAMPQGLQIDVRVKPSSQGSTMVLVHGVDTYRLELFRKREKTAFAVRFALQVFGPGQNHRNASPEPKVIETRGSPVLADAGWQRIQVSFDGMEGSIRVNGIEQIDSARKKRRRDASLDSAEMGALRTLAIPPRGAVQLNISDPANSFVGLMDSLHLSGVFRSDELQRDLPGGLDLVGDTVPVRVVYVNGRLDPDIHRNDVVLQFRNPTSEEDLPIELRLGRNGTIESSLALTAKSPRSSSGGK